ncbi:MAG TPA: isoleucine--tRNA ligase, partial [Chloroflexi bacterium]|nr:isoleucine--tRNA ligase [Chloroflexota bacterium]
TAGGELTVTVDSEMVTLSGEDVLVQTESRGGLAVTSEKGVTVAVDTELTPELIQEGYARDLVRTINTLRKDAGLALDDRIHVTYQADGETGAAVNAFADYIQRETLALSLTPGAPDGAQAQQTLKLGGEQVQVAIRRAG